MSHRKPICVHDTDNDMHKQHRSLGIQNTRSTNCLGCTQFKHNADHTCCAAPGGIERNEFKCSVRNERNQEQPRKKQNFLVPDDVQVLCDEGIDNNRKKVSRGKGRGYQMYQMKCEDDDRKFMKSLERREKVI